MCRCHIWHAPTWARLSTYTHLCTHTRTHARTLLPSDEPGCVGILSVVLTTPWHQVLISIRFFFIQYKSKSTFVGLHDFLSSYCISVLRFIFFFINSPHANIYLTAFTVDIWHLNLTPTQTIINSLLASFSGIIRGFQDVCVCFTS